jgi:hypothetical protein
VSPEEQTRRLKSRFEDGRKTWKLSPMDLKSYNRWYDYSRARDAMFLATDTNFAPWRVAPSNNKKKVRLNIISDILKRVPYKELPREKLKLPPRTEGRDGYVEPDYPLKFIAQSLLNPPPCRIKIHRLPWPASTSRCATGVPCTFARSALPTRPNSCRRSSA